MANNLELTILTPEKQFFKGEIGSVITKGFSGEFEVLKNHAPLIAVLQPTITVFTDLEGKEYKAFTSTGILQVKNNEVTILCDACDWPEDIDAKRAEEAKARAEERLKDEKVDKVRAELALARAVTRLKIKG